MSTRHSELPTVTFVICSLLLVTTVLVPTSHRLPIVSPGFLGTDLGSPPTTKIGPANASAGPWGDPLNLSSLIRPTSGRVNIGPLVDPLNIQGHNEKCSSR